MNWIVKISIYCIAISAIECASMAGGDQDIKFVDRVGRYCEVSKCNEYQYAWGPDFMAAYNFNEMSQNVQPNGYHVRLTLFVTAPLNAKIRLGETENHTHLDFVLGGSNNTLSWIQLNDNQTLQKLQTPNIITDASPHRVSIEITKAGLIQVYIEHYKQPFIQAPYLNPSPITYISFAADDNNYAEYFFDCEDRDSGDDQFATTTTARSAVLLISDGSIVSCNIFIIAIIIALATLY